MQRTLTSQPFYLNAQSAAQVHSLRIASIQLVSQIVPEKSIQIPSSIIEVCVYAVMSIMNDDETNMYFEVLQSASTSQLMITALFDFRPQFAWHDGKHHVD